MVKANDEFDHAGIRSELHDIKRLLMLALVRQGTSQGELAKALGVSQPSISRMFQGGMPKAVRPKDHDR